MDKKDASTEDKKPLKKTVKEEDLKRIEAHGALKSLSQGEFAGLKVYMGWASGKEVTDTAFDKVLKEFRGAPIKTRGVK